MQTPLRRFRFTVTKTLSILTLFTIVVALVSGCATDLAGEAGQEAPGRSGIEASPDIPQAPDLGPEQRTAPLRYPRLLDDPETVADARTDARRDGVRNDNAGPLGPATDPLIEELLASLTLRQRIGQRFIAHVPGSRVSYGAGRAIVEVAPAGFIIYPVSRRRSSALSKFHG